MEEVFMDTLIEKLKADYQSYLKNYTKGQIVFTDRSQLRTENVVIDGSMIEVFSYGEKEKESSTLLYRSGDFFGRFNQKSDNIFKTTGIARSDLELLSFPEDLFFRLIKTDPDLNSAFIASLCNIFIRLEKKYCALSMLSPTQRVVDMLIVLQDKSLDGVIHLTTSNLALALSTTRQTVSKVLNSLKRKNLLESSYKNIKILDISKVKSLYNLGEDK